MFLVSTFCAMLLIVTFIYAGIKKLTVFKEFTASLELTFKVSSKLSKIVSLIIILTELTILP
ncbi:MauE/DoxX family redox-associated membrane protein, partial [Pseudoalteromonas ostreae]